jgi:DNA replication protein DnaC
LSAEDWAEFRRLYRAEGSTIARMLGISRNPVLAAIASVGPPQYDRKPPCGHRVLFATAAEWVARLAEAHQTGSIHAQPIRLGLYQLLSSTRSATSPSNPKLQTCSSNWCLSRYERASLVITSSKAFGRWSEVFGDDIVAAAMIDRLVHHAEVITPKGASDRLKNRDLACTPAATTTEE